MFLATRKTPVNLLTLILSSYILVALLIAIMVRRAPVGYEDESGFHRGERPLEATASDHSLSAKY